ncbi:DEHA2B12342p [Debaryomyces hansenii CBS767]|jgi:regulator of RNase E activity RraA|uniref:DEHA2B12342p n=1 Tax=Debaryomyces hansenii (strain ATCC 36239 / CBS 767 / BCRC 21394 / JCM 1990 / NBRC 0083 / IGC 2968) TaxID=284592 RepID=Q6BWC8_DEBHA|nr:DEHA2B12342p [Debaryomyces hansenii CBS767]CAG85495.1 DEHA2B12342p [Debaryomyces hansenii CBS767]|eukprot:XP_457491.1 DEHA2B12342p [Debaryomyces hansenii CBS767]
MAAVSKKFSSKEIISVLSKFTPCDVSDSLVQHGISNGGYIPNLQIRSPATVTEQTKTSVGPAYTVLYAPKSDPRPAIKESYIDNIPENSILVIGLPPSCQTTNAPYVTVNNALYGGLMSTRAQYRSANGSIILGRIRDLDEHNDLGYPVWSYGVGSTAPGPVVKVVGINVPLDITVAGIDSNENLKVNPGDIMIADKNGVVRLPVSEHEGKEGQLDIESVLDYIPKRVDADTKVSEDIKKGKPAAEAQKFWRSKI